MEGCCMSQKKTSLKLPIFLIVGPIAMIILSIILYAIVNFIVGSFTSESTVTPSISDGASVSQGGDAELYGDTSIFTTIANILLFLLGAVGMLTLVPGLIVGIILLNKRKANRDDALSRVSPSERNWEDIQ